MADQNDKILSDRQRAQKERADRLREKVKKTVEKARDEHESGDDSKKKESAREFVERRMHELDEGSERPEPP